MSSLTLTVATSTAILTVTMVMLSLEEDLTFCTRALPNVSTADRTLTEVSGFWNKGIQQFEDMVVTMVTKYISKPLHIK